MPWKRCIFKIGFERKTLLKYLSVSKLLIYLFLIIIRTLSVLKDLSCCFSAYIQLFRTKNFWCFTCSSIENVMNTRSYFPIHIQRIVCLTYHRKPYVKLLFLSMLVPSTLAWLYEVSLSKSKHRPTCFIFQILTENRKTWCFIVISQKINTEINVIK